LIFALVPKQKNQTLQRVDLYNNKIGDVGAAALGEGIAVSCVACGCWLFLLLVTRPPVTDLISVILVLQKNAALQVLSLNVNQIGDAGAAALADGIKVSPV
jgi:hypothetical protein